MRLRSPLLGAAARPALLAGLVAAGLAAAPGALVAQAPSAAPVRDAAELVGQWRILAHPLEAWGYLDLEPDGRYRLWSLRPPSAGGGVAEVIERGTWKMRGGVVRELCFDASGPSRVLYEQCGAARLTRTPGRRRASLEWRASEEEHAWLGFSGVAAVPVLVYDEKRRLLARAGGDAHFPFEVDSGVRYAPGNASPAYPAEMKRAGIAGRVVLELEVDSAGRADPATITPMSATHDAFADAAVAAVRDWRFVPARIDGRAVRQLVELPMVFAAPREAAANVTLPGTIGDARIPELEIDVETPVRPVAGSPRPVYAQYLVDARVEGQVVALFVVDTAGRVEVPTFRVLEATHAEFLEAVGKALPKMRFVPATVGGRPVRQLVQQPFQFYIRK